MDQIGDPNFMKSILLELKFNFNPVIVGDLNTLLSLMDRSFEHKNKKSSIRIQRLNKLTPQISVEHSTQMLKNIYSIQQPM